MPASRNHGKPVHSSFTNHRAIVFKFCESIIYEYDLEMVYQLNKLAEMSVKLSRIVKLQRMNSVVD